MTVCTPGVIPMIPKSTRVPPAATVTGRTHADTAVYVPVPPKEVGLPYTEQQPALHSTSGLVHAPGPHTPSVHVVPPVADEQTTHAPPALPHAAGLVPATQSEPEQHPSPHDSGVHVHALSTQPWPLGHAPSPHCPPHPSLAPHAAPSHDGVQPQRPPEHVSGAVHVSPPQHA